VCTSFVRLTLLAATLAVVSCSSPAATPSIASDAGSDVSSPPNGFAHDVVLSVALTVPPGAELHQCQYLRLPEGADLDVVRIAHQYTPGSHHFLLYRTDLTSIPADATGQYDCTRGDEPIMDHARGVLYAAQSTRGDFPFPPGVGLTLEGGAVVLFQTHYINAGASDLAVRVDLGLDTAPPETIQQKAGFLLFYDPFIDVPARGTASSGIRCPIPSDINLLTGVTHYHQRGTGMKVYVDPAAGAPPSTPLFETHDWDHPATFAGPVPIEAGSTVRFGCEFDNASGADEIFQGPNAQTSEMCVFAGLYYPVPADSTFETCRAPSVVGDGPKACLDVARCIQACPAGDAPNQTLSGVQVGPCWQRCVASGCDGAVDTFFPLGDCVSSQCSAECDAGRCTECITTRCADALSACSSQTCK
jgi:hypothetical protein